ncbi:MAG: ABC1 kinase family protein [Desulfotomaculales bacterium]
MYGPLGRRLLRFKRYRQMARVLARHGFDYFVDQIAPLGTPLLRPFRKRPRPPRHSAPERLRMVLQELGPTFIKLGQLLSTRADLLPEDYVSELEKLQDAVPPFPFEEVRRQVERELGRPLEAVFADFDRTCLAAASVAQVHRARLAGGEEVVVKVQRPGVEDVIAVDLDILYDVARLLERRTHWGRVYSFTDTAEEFRRTMHEETDFRAEGRNTETLRRHALDDPHVYIPRVHWDLTSRRVLTLEYVQAVKLTDVAALEAMGIDRTAVARRLARNIVKQMLVDGVFHADPHPGNLAVLPDGRITFFDFGITGRLPADLREQLGLMVLGLVRKDTGRVMRALYRMGVVPPEVDAAALRRDIERLRQKYYEVPLAEVDVAESFRDLLRVAYKHRVRLPSELTLLIKALVTADGVIEQLDREVSIAVIARPLVKKLAAGHFSPERFRRYLEEALPEYAHLLARLPALAGDILEQAARGKLRIREENPALGELVPRIEAIVARLSAGLVAAALFVAAALLGRHPVKLFGFLPLAETSFVAACVLAAWLALALLRRRP